jgi:hypothetical protein
MRIQPIQPASPINKSKPKAVDLAEYRRIKDEVEKHQPDAEASFDRMNQVLIKAFPWFMVMVVIYLAAQLSRALANGWLP